MKPCLPALIWVAVRPRTLLLVAAPILLGTAAALAYGIRWSMLAVTILTAALIQAGTNVYNDYADCLRGADKERTGPQRITAEGLMRPRQVRGLAIALMFASVCTGSWLVAAGGWPILLIGMSGILFGFAYTGGPWPLAYNGLADIVVWAYFGPIAVAGTAYLLTGQWLTDAWWLGAAIGLPAAAVLVVNNYRDRDTDILVHKRTLAVRFGLRFSARQYLACLLGAPAVLGTGYLYGFGGTSWLASLAVVPLAAILYRRLRTRTGTDLNPVLGQTVGYALLLAIVVSIAMVLE